jgi:hypothetical protein
VPDLDLEGAGLDPEGQLPRVQIDAGRGEGSLRNGSDPWNAASARWQALSASPAATASTGPSAGSAWVQKLSTRPSCSCGPGGSSSDGATTGAPARARWPATASSRRCHAGPGRTLAIVPATRATTGAGRR